MPQRKIIMCVGMKAFHLLACEGKYFNLEDTVTCKAFTGLVLREQGWNAFEDTQVPRDTNPSLHLYLNQKNSIETNFSAREYYLNRTQSFQLLDEKLVFYEPREKWVECYHKITHGLQASRVLISHIPEQAQKSLGCLIIVKAFFILSHNQLFM